MSDTNDLLKYFEVAERLVRQAGEIVKNASIISEECTDKTSHADIVTVYDKKVEKTINSALKDCYPSHRFIGEESVFDTKASIVLTDEPTWILDPIDGTLNFAHSFPYCCISLALAINKQIEVGVVYNPFHNEFFSAIRQQGAFLNKKPIKGSEVSDITSALVCSEAFLCRVHKKHTYRLNKIVNACQGVRSLGSAALNLCYVASGALDAFEIEYVSIWDVAAASLIVKEAGAIIKSIKGGPFDLLQPACVAAGTEKLADKIIEICIESEQQN